jgi:ribosomal protein L31
MKSGIHPDYHPVVFQDATTGAMFLIDDHQFAHHRVADARRGAHLPACRR